MDLLSFREISGIKFLSANVALEYGSNSHLAYSLAYTTPSLIVLILVIPLVMFLGIRKAAVNKKL